MLKTIRHLRKLVNFAVAEVRTKEIWVTEKTPIMTKIPIIKTLIQKI